MLLEWTVPPECPSASEVSAQVVHIAGEELARTPIEVRGAVRKVEDRHYRLELRIGASAESLRSVESDDCRKLAGAAAVIIALDLQSHALVVEPDVPETVLVRTPEPLSTPPAPMAGSPLAGHLHAGFGADISFDVGTLPTLGWGGGVHGFLRYRPFRWELAAALWPRRRADAPGLSSAGAYVSMRTVSFAGCVTLLPDVELSTCLRIEGADLRATGFGVRHPSTADGFWLAGFVGASVRPLRWSRVAPRMNIELGAPLRNGDVEIEHGTLVHRSSDVVFRFVLGVETTLF
ncbi:hypothetical protein AKJ09_01729 [Labilithrix luteola]|uniref:Uncharacterized protein n=1 Tax=Labilithrix luteola TaxID=1391654 RepID=A0A0K1PNE7_9BACT|nr:hypothetical protein [Labilithrix luteola]AKU95065.1 hypothetical protein AKJ09_01729 [Labilithrix luteola]